MTSKTKKIIIPELDILDFNKNIYELLKNCCEEISYKIYDIDYTKNVQRILSQNHSQFRNLEKQFLDYSLNIQDILPLVPSLNIYNKLVSSITFTPINEDVHLIFSQLKNLNFQMIFKLSKIIFNEINKNNTNNSQFIKKISKIFESNPSSWTEIETHGNNIVFYILQLFCSNINDLKITVSETDILNALISTKNITCIYSKKTIFTNDGIKNLFQQVTSNNDEILITNIPFINSETPKSEYELFSYIILDTRTRKTELTGYTLTSNSHNSFLKGFYSLFHHPTIKFLNERKHNYIYNHLYTFLNTFNIFLTTKIHPIDRMRYLLAGSVIKSMYNVRDCADVDFFVLDHEDNIEKYGRYAPNIGIEGIFDDFGKTYYANEDFYFPMIPEMYEKQKEIKKKEEKSEIIPKNIMNNFPKYSVSGLKAGRYIDIYSGECKKIGFNIDNLDDLVSDPDFRIYFLGCPVINLKLEMIRDIVKDIDLGRISRKQLHDLHFLKNNYEYLFSHSDTIELGLNRFKEPKEKLRRNKINIGLNCYHKDLISDEKVGYDLVIRRYPLYIEEMTKKIILEAPLLISTDNAVYDADIRLTYQKPLLSSLPAKMLIPSKREIPVIYYYEISDMGEIKIYVNTEEETADVSFFKNVCITGNIKVEINEGIKKISISVSGEKMKKIYSQIPGQDKKYKLILINYLKNLIQLHKIIDCHTIEKINIDAIK